MAYPFAPSTYRNPNDCFSLHLFSRYQPITEGHITPIIVSPDDDNSTWILLSPPNNGTPIQPGTVVQAYEPDNLNGNYVFQAVAAGPIDFDRQYILFALYDFWETEHRHAFDLAVPHSWSWISEEDQVEFATYRQERHDDYFPFVTLHLEDLYEMGIPEDNVNQQVILDHFPFDNTLRPPANALRRSRSLPNLREEDLLEMTDSDDWGITNNGNAI